VPEIIAAVIDRIPPPKQEEEAEYAPLRMLIFDSCYDHSVGTVVVTFRVVSGCIRKGTKISLVASKKDFVVDTLGTTVDGVHRDVPSLATGEVGYLTAAINQVADARVGDTIAASDTENSVEALPGYADTKPMVFCGLFTKMAESYDVLKAAFDRLALDDAGIAYVPEKSLSLGFGFRCSFRGIQHMKVVTEHLERECGSELIRTTPSLEYQVALRTGGTKNIRFANQLPVSQQVKSIAEPWVLLEMIVLEENAGTVMDLAKQRRAIYKSTKFLTHGHLLLLYEMPMEEVIRFPQALEGLATMDYRPLDNRVGDLVKLEVDINKMTAYPLTQIVHRCRAIYRGRLMCWILRDHIPAQQLRIVIQARIGTMVVYSKFIGPVRQDMLKSWYGRNITRQVKLLMWRSRGRKKMQAIGQVVVPPEAILAVMRSM